MNEWAQFISSVGFPIAASCGMFYLYNKTISEITSTLSLMNQTLQDICHKLERSKDNDTE
jgi:hypothetical protein